VATDKVLNKIFIPKIEKHLGFGCRVTGKEANEVLAIPLKLEAKQSDIYDPRLELRQAISSDTLQKVINKHEEVYSKIKNQPSLQQNSTIMQKKQYQQNQRCLTLIDHNLSLFCGLYALQFEKAGNISEYKKYRAKSKSNMKKVWGGSERFLGKESKEADSVYRGENLALCAEKAAYIDTFFLDPYLNQKAGKRRVVNLEDEHFREFICLLEVLSDVKKDKGYWLIGIHPSYVDIFPL
jgi:hypothetical protein